MSAYSFGFLAERVTLTFDWGEIVHVHDFDAAMEWVLERKHTDGFLYPPTVVGSADGRTEIRNTRRPAHLHHVPASHMLRCTCAVGQDDQRRTDASLIVQLVTYLFDTWLQFDGW